MPPGAKGWGAKMRIEILANFSLQKVFLKKFKRFHFRPKNIMSSYYELLSVVVFSLN